MQSFVAHEVKMNRSEMDALMEKMGGRYRFTVLVQKRVKELTRGAARLVDMEGRNLIRIAIEEIKQGKVGIEAFPELDDESGKTKKRKKE